MPPDNIITFVIMVLLMFAFVVAGNILLIHLLINKAIKCYIKPLLESKGCIYVNYKCPGLFSHGDFKYFNTGFTTMSGSGKNRFTIYAYIFYTDKIENTSKRSTAKIDIAGLSVKNIEYSSDI